MSAREKYTAVIGLEVHAQLLTKSKIFCGDSTEYGAPANSQVSVITLAHPGTLPKLNRKTAEYAMKMGLACHSEITRLQIMDRKNYFYPDLPKGYQLTQDRTPICKGGYVTIDLKDGTEHQVRLHRIHMEEDAGKSIHLAGETETMLDFNRAGVSLIEIVTLPEIRNSDEAYAFLAEVRKLVRYLEICDGNMEEGSLRCDANVSVMLNDAKEFGKKVEIKNMNSLRNVQRAIDHEIERQIDQLEKGIPITSETRTFDATTGLTYGMRTKEELNDYRYFPDPDLSPLHISEEWLQSIMVAMPSLPRERAHRYVTHFQLPQYDALVLTDSPDISDYFEKVCKLTTNYKAASNWVMGPVKSHLNDTGRSANECPVSPAMLSELIALIDEGKLNFSIASRQLFPALLEATGDSVLQMAHRLNLIQESGSDTILPLVEEVIREFPLKVEEYKKGKKAILSMFMGEVMKRSNGKADPRVATELLKQKLEKI